jgi:hypothetical protein
MPNILRQPTVAPTAQHMPTISKIEVRPLDSKPSRLEYFIDGRPLYDLLPDYEKFEKVWYESPIGHCSPDWQLRTLNQLLLRAPPDVPDGRRRIYLCCGDCECAHISCFIEISNGIVTWRGFHKGSAYDRVLEHLDAGQWKRVRLVPAPQPNGRELTGGPFCFEERQYRGVFERIETIIKKFRDCVAKCASSRVGQKHNPAIVWTQVDRELTQMGRHSAAEKGIPFQRPGGE